ncbi:GrpB family protein [Paenibacillus tyrfis]|uniref:GrpB family protein n=1 Tax=Paenibacillus tyrfis TaxID=1501230 RepID=UPI002166BD2A|nr:GrpB family protein [Paenibacillus tyrfis]
MSKEYGELKSKLADKYPTDTDSYGDGKNDFVKKIEKEALNGIGQSAENITQLYLPQKTNRSICLEKI